MPKTKQRSPTSPDPDDEGLTTPADIQEVVDELADLLELERDLEEEIEARSQTITDKIIEIERKRERLEDEAAALRGQIYKAGGEYTDELLDLRVDIDQKRKQLKATLHALPAEAVREKQTFEAPGLRVRVNRAQTFRTYDVEGLLAKFPDLKDRVVDGETLTPRIINEAVMERLIQKRVISEEDLAPFLSEETTRAPSVHIEEVTNHRGRDDG